MIDELLRKVEPDLFRIRLASPTGLVVNAWLLHDAGHAILIDAGFPWTTEALEGALGARGLRLEDLDALIYTHTHQDHMGGGIRFGARVREHVVDSRASDFFRSWHSSFAKFPVATAAYRAELPGDERTQSVLSRLAREADPVVVGEDPGHSVRARITQVGEVVEYGPWALQSIDVAGHDPSHVAWYDAERGRLFVGDAVMRVPTPFSLHLLDEPGLWLDALDRVEALDVGRLLPGHGMPTRLVSESVRRSRGHLERQLEALQDTSERGLFHPLDVVERLLENERARYDARLGVSLATTLTLIRESVELGSLRIRPDRMVETVYTPPELEDLRELSHARRGKIR